MNRRKGVSQVLALIIAAAVLMMAALTVIFLTQSSLGDTNQNKKASTCQEVINSKCQFDEDGTIQKPSVCNGIEEEVPRASAGSDTVTC